VSCEQRKRQKFEKTTHLKNLISKIGFIKLPLTYDIAGSKIGSTYSINGNSMDTLFFRSGQLGGVLPDTANFYCILHYQVGDSIYPFLTTIDKSANVIDKQNIGIGYCGGLMIDVDECTDQVTIHEDMSLDLLYKATGTVDDDSTQQTVRICNEIVGKGKISELGKIEITKTDLMDCN
jgi:hypothetical protein